MENNLKYIVYQTINIINNKIYIGIHGTKDPMKFDGYIGNGVNINYPSTYMNPKFPFQFAVKKYGTSNFKRSVLYIYDTEIEALLKEEEIVNENFIKRNDTYNIAIGGKKRPYIPTYNKIYQFDKIGKLIKIWNNIYEVSDFFETWKQSIYSAINKKQRLYGFYWSYQKKIHIEEFSNPNQNRKVYQYSKEGKCIAIYNSIGEASSNLNISQSNIINNINNGSLTKNDYYLSYKLYDQYVCKPRMDLKNKLLYLYDLDGNFIDSINVKDFKKKYNIHSYKELENAILNNKPIQKNQIKLEKFNKIEKYIPINKKKKVEIYKMNGDFVSEFDSVSNACKQLKLDRSTVSKILRGCAKQTKGYTIKYKN